MKGETGELRLQKPKLVSTGRLSRNKSVWRFQGRPTASNAGSDSRSNSEHMAVAVDLPRPPALKELLGSWSHRERLDQGRQEASDDEDVDESELELECRGCKKISRDEGRKRSPSSIALSFHDTGESST